MDLGFLGYRFLLDMTLTYVCAVLYAGPVLSYSRLSHF